MWPESNSTEELLVQVRAGEPEAIDRLLERHREPLRRMIDMRMDAKIQTRIDASDIVQDVMIDASRRLREYLQDPLMPFHLWLRHIARDRIIDAHRRHRVSAKRSVDREQRAAGRVLDHSTVELVAQICDVQLTPAAAATLQELQQQFQAAIAEMDDQDREVVLMRHFEHLSNQDVANSLGLSEPAASMRYLRAMRRLRVLLTDPNASLDDRKD
ncbi:MAG: sigma-70 family RNA polymerase sigma factor [Planctomycetota bacterium]|nr:sigma-70 family RNA polymerase sigma factor [Planctomycetota bacterium]MDA1179314.1 sigma-70 family RNA polymerase sigma factor [Planctomycetota bacterium]